METSLHQMWLHLLLRGVKAKRVNMKAKRVNMKAKRVNMKAKRVNMQVRVLLKTESIVWIVEVGGGSSPCSDDGGVGDAAPPCSVDGGPRRRKYPRAGPP